MRNTLFQTRSLLSNPRPTRAVAALAAIGLGAVVASATQAAVTASPSARELTLEQARAQLAQMSLPWVPNHGQWDARAAFRAQSFAGAVWLTHDGVLVHQFNGPKAADCTDRLGLRGKTKREAACPRAPGWVLTERFLGSRIGPIEGRHETPGRVSYQVGDPARHANDLPSYETLDLGEVYPGVQVALRASQANVEKLYTVAPGGDPGAIRMRLEGARSVRLTAEGALEADTDHGPIRFTPPIAFQLDTRGHREPVEVAYVLDTNTQHADYGFRLGRYDPSRPLVIDPLL